MAHDAKHARAIRKIANTSGHRRAARRARPDARRDQPRHRSRGSRASTSPICEMAMELARRISLALDNARLFAEAQERAHAAEALEYVADGVFLVDEPGIVRLWNPTAAISLRRPAVGRGRARRSPSCSPTGHRSARGSRSPSEPRAGRRARRDAAGGGGGRGAVALDLRRPLPGRHRLRLPRRDRRARGRAAEDATSSRPSPTSCARRSPRSTARR